MLREANADAAGAGSVVTLSFANPFPMLMDQPSPMGTPIWLHRGRTYSDEIFVHPERFFNGVNFVMSTATPGALDKIYAKTLSEDFYVAAKGLYWTLHIRRSPQPDEPISSGTESPQN